MVPPMWPHCHLHAPFTPQIAAAKDAQLESGLQDMLEKWQTMEGQHQVWVWLVVACPSAWMDGCMGAVCLGLQVLASGLEEMGKKQHQADEWQQVLHRSPAFPSPSPCASLHGAVWHELSVGSCEH